MELQGKTVLVLGGAGLVGQAICRQLIPEQIGHLIVTSLKEHDAKECVAGLQRLFPASACTFSALWGDMFAPFALKDQPREARVADPARRKQLTDAVLGPLDESVLTQSTLHQWCTTHRPQIIVDCVNSATSLAYTDIYTAAQQLRTALGREASHADITDLTEKTLLSMPLPQLIRHVQILWHSMLEARTGFYLKIGTSGTGGMGITMPYTHSEGKDAQLVLAKAAVAGAHTLLLFLLARTPGGPIVKELKPAAYIAWKRIGFGPILHRGQPLQLEDCPPAQAVDLVAGLMQTPARPHYLTDASGAPRLYEAPFIDTGENGMWALSEFALVTDAAQMEFITPEEIGESVISEIQGRNTGHDIVAALDNSCLGPSYRAGYMRKTALARLQQLERDTGVESIAFEMPGPLAAKLLYEAHLLARCFPSCEAVLESSAPDISAATHGQIADHAELRARILSVGIPILLPDGRKLLRGQTVHIPSANQRAATPSPTAAQCDRWAHEGWVDLRPVNWTRWQTRLRAILDELGRIDTADTSSYNAQGHRYWDTAADGTHPIQISKLVSWIFRTEEQGERMKD